MPYLDIDGADLQRSNDLADADLPEGDAVCAYATNSDALPRGAGLLACIEACYAGFQDRLGAAHEIWTCRCGACLRIDALDLKFILHAGGFVTQEIAGRTELVGPEVAMAHRLLKNEAADQVGHRAYALVTAAAATRYAVPTDRAIRLVARYEHYPPIDAFAFPLR